MTTTKRKNVVLNVSELKFINLMRAALALGALIIQDRAYYFGEARIGRKRVMFGRLVDNNKFRVEMTYNFFRLMNGQPAEEV